MIVELFGCPGAGKTYILNLIKGNTKIAMVSTDKHKAALISLAKSAVIYLPSMMVLKYRLKMAISKKKYTPIYIDKSVDYFLNKIIIVAFGYNRWPSDKNLYMDEGIIHRVISLAVNYNLEIGEIKNLLRILEPYISRANIFFLDVPEKVCFKSVHERKRKDCEMDFFDDATMIKYIQAYSKYFNFVCDFYRYQRITREKYSVLEDMIK